MISWREPSYRLEHIRCWGDTNCHSPALYNVMFKDQPMSRREWYFCWYHTRKYFKKYTSTIKLELLYPHQTSYYSIDMLVDSDLKEFLIHHNEFIYNDFLHYKLALETDPAFSGTHFECSCYNCRKDVYSLFMLKFKPW